MAFPAALQAASCALLLRVTSRYPYQARILAAPQGCNYTTAMANTAAHCHIKHISRLPDLLSAIDSCPTWLVQKSRWSLCSSISPGRILSRRCSRAARGFGSRRDIIHLRSGRRIVCRALRYNWSTAQDKVLMHQRARLE